MGAVGTRPAWALLQLPFWKAGLGWYNVLEPRARSPHPPGPAGPASRSWGRPPAPLHCWLSTHCSLLPPWPLHVSTPGLSAPSWWDRGLCASFLMRLDSGTPGQLMAFPRPASRRLPVSAVTLAQRLGCRLSRHHCMGCSVQVPESHSASTRPLYVLSQRRRPDVCRPSR